jgi:hypothetical protein
VTRSGFGYNAAEVDDMPAPSTQVQVVSPTTITAVLNPFGRAPGTWKIVLTQGNGGTASFGDGVTSGLVVAGSKPTISSISPTRINSDDTNKQFTLHGAGFAKGMTATVSGNGVTQTAPIDVQSPTTAILRLTATSSPGTGPRMLTLRNADNQSSENADALCVNCDLPTAGGPPTITSVSPVLLGQGAENVQMTVKGTNFGPLATASVSPNGTGTSAIQVGTTRDSATQLTLTVTVGSAAPAGPRDLTVTNTPAAGGGEVTDADAFTISTDFHVTNLTPPGRPRGYTGTIAINGSGFTGSPEVTINPGTDITLGTPRVDSPALITVPITVGPTADISPRDVLVKLGSNTQTCTGCFKVGLVPTVTSITPTTGNGGGKVDVSAINGTNFRPGATVSLERADQPAVTMIDTNVDQANNKISGTFDLANAAPGKWNLRVTNADGGTAVLPNAFTVVVGSPTVTNATPDTVQQGAQAAVITITGTSFAPGMTVTFPAADGVNVTKVERTDPTTAKVTLAVDPNARLASRDLTVTNADGKSGTCDSCIVVVQGVQQQVFGPGITAYENFTGGAFVAAGNIDGVPSNGVEFVTGPNAGGGPHVRPYRINPTNGAISEIGGGFMAYDQSFTGGVHVAVGNVDGVPGDEIVTGAGPGGGPHVKVFHVNNDLSIGQPVGGGFFAYGPSFTGGVFVATGDVDGDGTDEIITGAGPGGGPHVRAWKLAADKTSFTEVFGVMAYDPAFAGGVAVGAGNVVPEASEAAQLDEIVTVPSSGGGSHTRIFGGSTLKREFFAFGPAVSDGYRVAVGDFNFDSIADVAVSRVSASELFVAQVKQAAPQYEKLVDPNLTPFGNGSAVGANVAAADIDNDGDLDLIVSPDHNSAVTIRLIRPRSA